MNISWSWSRNARTLFATIDEPLWHFTRHNPIQVLRRVHPERLSAVARDPQFLEMYDRLMQKLERERSNQDTWFAKNQPDLVTRPIAYFCAEFGLHNSVPIYSGGLGVLAGDHCKAASDLGVPLVGVGLFYTKGYFDQHLRLDGWQEDTDEQFDPSSAPLEQVFGPGQKPWLAVVQTHGRDIHVGAWRMMVGRVPVYFLDTNLEENDPQDRDLASKLYAGGPDLRLRQEWILGVGGVRVLRAVGIEPAAWHANEGHAAFMLVERVREYVLQGVDFDEAVRRVRATSVFTTHTPVPAGHDSFMMDQVAECTGPIWDEMKVPRERIAEFGRHPIENHGQFHMTVAALRLSSHVNGVAKRHGEVSREIWRNLWPERTADDVPIGHITNGVHLATWMARDVMELLDEKAGKHWGSRLDEPGFWDCVLSIDDGELWRAHHRMKRRLIGFIREQARRRWARQWKEAAHVVGAGTLLDPNALTIGFARRFATYKRANLIFEDLERLRELLTNQRRPVQLDLRRQSASVRQSGQGDSAGGLQLQPGSEPGRARRVHRGLRPAPGARARAGRGSLDEPAARSDGSERDERDEGGAEWRAAPLDARWMVAGGVRWPERLGDPHGGSRHRRRSRRCGTPVRSSRASCGSAFL